jgi:hypothetical protein
MKASSVVVVVVQLASGGRRGQWRESGDNGQTDWYFVTNSAIEIDFQVLPVTST